MSGCECGGNCKTDSVEQPFELVAGELVSNGQDTLTSVIRALSDIASYTLADDKTRKAANEKLIEIIGQIKYSDLI